MSEIALPGFRGALLSAFSLSFALGQFFSAVGQQILVKTSPLEFRRAFYSEFVILGLWLLVLVTLPESPYWLSRKGKHDKARRALQRLIGNVEGYDVELEYSVIQQEVENSIAFTASQGSSDWAAMRKPVNMKRTLIAALPFTYQNFVGTPLVFGESASPSPFQT
jgi:MFS family permease